MKKFNWRTSILLLFLFGFAIWEGKAEISVGDLEKFTYENNRNLLQLESSEGPWTCNSLGSSFKSYSISIASFNSSSGSNSTAFSPLSSCSPQSASGLGSSSPLMLISCLYSSPSFGTFILKSNVVCNNGFQSSPSYSNSFFFLGSDGSASSLSSIQNNPNALDSSFAFQLSSNTFNGSEEVSGLYLKTVNNVEGTTPDGFEEGYWGSLSFNLDGLTPNGFRPSGPLNEPITITIKWIDFDFDKYEAARLNLFYLDSTNSFVSVASSCGSSNYSSINLSDKTWTVKICHLTPYKAFLATPPPTTAVSPSVSDTLQSNSPSSPITTETADASGTNNQNNNGDNSFISQTASGTAAAILTPQDTSSGKLGTGAIVGIVVGVVGGLLLLILIIVAVVFLRRKKESDDRAKKRDIDSYSPEALNQMYLAGVPQRASIESRTASWIKASGKKTTLHDDPPPYESSDDDEEKAKVRNVKLTFDQPQNIDEGGSSNDDSATDELEDATESSEQEEASEHEQQNTSGAGAIVSVEKEAKSDDENSEDEERSSSVSSESSDESDNDLPPYSIAVQAK